MRSRVLPIHGKEIFVREWTVSQPKAKVLLVHGYAEHCGRYDHFAEFLSKHQIALYSYDLQGHGKSSGSRANVKRFGDYISELDAVSKEIRSTTKDDAPWFLMGHSMGGLISVVYTLEHKPSWAKGVILSAPAMKIQDDISPLLQKMSGVIGAIAPWLATVKLEAQWISKDPKVREEYNNDPLIYRGGTKARFGAESIKTMKATQSRFAEFMHPILIMHGDDDRLIDPKGSQLLFDGISSADKQLQLVPTGYHEILNEPDQEETMATMTSWITDRIANS